MNTVHLVNEPSMIRQGDVLVMPVTRPVNDEDIGELIRDNLEANLGDNLRANLWANRLDFFSTYFWGSLDSYWVAFYLFPHEKLRPIHTDDQMQILNGWADLTKSCFWFYAFKNVCFVCEKPIVINKDEAGRLHCESGPSVAFEDSWGIYNWHGVTVPRYVIESPEQITANKINEEDNAEVKRVMIERYGFDKYLKDSNAVPMHSDNYGDLFRLKDSRLPVVKVTNKSPEPDGTYKDYVLTALNSDVNTAHAAVASTFGLTAEQYKPVAES